jgi:hypothetical protein
MTPKRILTIAGMGALLAAALPAQSNSCGRACLEGYVDQFMDAVIAHDPAKLPMTRNVKYTENGQRLDPGDGFWRTASAKGAYRLFVDDSEDGQVAFMGTMKEAGIPVILALHMRIVNRQIPEVEAFVLRNQQAAENLEKRGHPNPLFTEAIPASERMSHADLIKTANMYFSGLQLNDGKGDYPFTADCNRLENGVQTTNNPDFVTGSLFASQGGPGGRGRGRQAAPPPNQGTQFNPARLGCLAQFKSGYFHFVTRIRDRRFVAVDPERGLVFSFIFFDHAAGKYRTFKLADGRTISAGPTTPWTWEIAEMFRIEKGKIRRVEAVLDHVPYGMLSGWSDWEDGMSSRARDVTKQ